MIPVHWPYISFTAGQNNLYEKPKHCLASQLFLTFVSDVFTYIGQITPLKYFYFFGLLDLHLEVAFAFI